MDAESIAALEAGYAYQSKRAETAYQSGYFDGIQMAKAVFETGGENALRKLVQDERTKRLNAVLAGKSSTPPSPALAAAKGDTQQGEREGGNEP